MKRLVTPPFLYKLRDLSQCSRMIATICGDIKYAQCKTGPSSSVVNSGEHMAEYVAESIEKRIEESSDRVCPTVHPL